MSKIIVHGEESRQAILRGVNVLADAVKVTLAPRAAMSSSIRNSVPPSSPRTA